MEEPKLWQRAVGAVAEAGRPISFREIVERLRSDGSEINEGSVRDTLGSFCVNSPSRTSHGGGSKPRLTNGGHRYDRLYKNDDGSYVPYDVSKHGVWEIYADSGATSTHGTKIRKLDGEAVPTLTVELTEGAIKPGNTFLPVRFADAGFFPGAFIRGKSPDTPATHAHFVTDAGTSFESDVYQSSSNSGYLHNRAAASAYYLAVGAKGGDRLRYEKLGDGRYRISLLPIQAAQASSHPGIDMTAPTSTPVNRILYGPPGTGKTYATVEEALRLLDPAWLEQHSGERKALKARFDALAEAGAIHFVTFHQSFSYEDFVEGIRASADEDSGQLRYEVEDGVFKQLCDAARSRTVADDGESVSLAGRRIWKLSLGEANSEGAIYEECIEQGHVLLGFGADADFAGVGSRAEVAARLKAAGEDVQANDYATTALNLFVRRMQVGDLVVVTQGNLKFRAIGEITGDYRRIDRDSADSYAQCRPVRWLRRYEPARPYGDLMENRFSQMTIYELRPGSINLQRLQALLQPEPQGAHAPEARVLIIDEINRGNVSRIFGELITLIEPSKREGAAEALSVTLPYSKQRFGVPANVHLIGTMNTADRSLAGLDVALRRRFEFVEMAPDPGKLAGVVVEGVAVADLLRVMNQRIEVLLGRDGLLGHAWFMGLASDPSLAALASVFRKQVLPLLQEYFFEDWQKIAWVLNDHRKPAPLRFVMQAEAKMAALFGNDLDLPGEARLWQVNEAAFGNIEAYRGVLQAPQVAG